MWKRGWWSFSRTSTCQPFSASKAATVEPAGPPPMTVTSQRFGSPYPGVIVPPLSSMLIGFIGLSP
jgi:hypothetical protein